MSASRKGRNLSEETKAKMSASSYNAGKPIYLRMSLRESPRIKNRTPFKVNGALRPAPLRSDESWPDQVYELLLSMAKEGLVGVYLWINKESEKSMWGLLLTCTTGSKVDAPTPIPTYTFANSVPTDPQVPKVYNNLSRVQRTMCDKGKTILLAADADKRKTRMMLVVAGGLLILK
ncbi:7107_t:CDS:2 [Acaulospora morrowiae]|uniref:7107_t:CDS:1 n=1 Tax=Acaulospora morrowiae TaxID=94023 RepID=A0A9N9AC88_9GLOM|nr:7107_t:CDS:2 [Acaulospora morrowiae]